jgi:hypothetical protein
MTSEQLTNDERAMSVCVDGLKVGVDRNAFLIAVKIAFWADQQRN